MGPTQVTSASASERGSDVSPSKRARTDEGELQAAGAAESEVDATAETAEADTAPSLSLSTDVGRADEPDGVGSTALVTEPAISEDEMYVASVSPTVPLSRRSC